MFTPLLPSSHELFERYADQVWRQVHRFGVSPNERDDAFQEVFVIAHMQRARFDGRAEPGAWLRGITFNVALRFRERAQRGRELPTEDVDRVGPTPNPEQALERKQDVLRVRELLAQLPDALREVFVLYEVEELSCEEIATLTGVEVGTVYSRLFRARERFEDVVRRGDVAARWMARVRETP